MAQEVAGSKPVTHPTQVLLAQSISDRSSLVSRMLLRSSMLRRQLISPLEHAGLHRAPTLPAGRICPRLSGMSLLDRISVDPTIRFGKPCVRGTRMTVGDVLCYLAAGEDEARILEEFPQLKPEDIRACLLRRRT